MSLQVFRVDKPAELSRAGATDLVQLLPVPGGHPLFVQKWILEAMVYSIAHRETIHLSGPTGSAKSSLVEALHRRPENFALICEQLDLPVAELCVFSIEMPTFESPAELWHRRALSKGSTYDEPSSVVRALTEAGQLGEGKIPLIWLREMGRVHASSVQGGLLDLIYKGDIVLPDRTRVDGTSIGWLADSNYQAEGDATHTLVVFDDALKRRFSVNLTLDYLPAEQEEAVLRQLNGDNGTGPEAPTVDDEPDLVQIVVRMGQVIRRHRLEGTLLSVPPPTIYGYLTFLRMAERLPHMSPQQVAALTLLGNASLDDRQATIGVFNEVFGVMPTEGGDPASGAHMF